MEDDDFAGTEHFDVSQADLCSRLNDMSFISSVIPDVDKIERLEQPVSPARPHTLFLLT